jgi:hypothetical protein
MVAAYHPTHHMPRLMQDPAQLTDPYACCPRLQVWPEHLGIGDIRVSRESQPASLHTLCRGQC